MKLYWYVHQKKLKDSFFGEKYRSSSFSAGLHKLFHLAIPDGRTWSKLGQHGEHGKDGKHQPQDLKHSIYDSKHSFWCFKSINPLAPGSGPPDTCQLKNPTTKLENFKRNIAWLVLLPQFHVHPHLSTYTYRFCGLQTPLSSSSHHILHAGAVMTRVLMMAS